MLHEFPVDPRPSLQTTVAGRTAVPLRSPLWFLWRLRRSRGAPGFLGEMPFHMKKLFLVKVEARHGRRKCQKKAGNLK